MSTYEKVAERPDIFQKGSVIWVQTIGTTVALWITSPTGDVTDSIIHNIKCVNEEQAVAVAKLWKAVWGII